MRSNTLTRVSNNPGARCNPPAKNSTRASPFATVNPAGHDCGEDDQDGQGGFFEKPPPWTPPRGWEPPEKTFCGRALLGLLGVDVLLAVRSAVALAGLDL